jgi:hypothetical protein
MKTIFIIFLFSFISVHSQDKSILELFPGKWKLVADNIELYEEWKNLSKTELTGMSFSIAEGQEVIAEELYIKKFGNQWAYISVPVGQFITLFALTSFSEGMFVFENKEHDFPQRIIYEFHEEGKLTASIEGNLKGEFKRKDYFFIKVND